MAAAAAAFSDSHRASMGMRRRRALCSSVQGLTPRPSLPTATAQRDRSAPPGSTAPSPRAAAYRGRPADFRAAASSSSSASQAGRRKAAPMVARMVLGPQGSAQWWSRMSPSTPMASAVRQTVPTLPGSCTPSSTRYCRPVSPGRGCAPRRQTNSAPWGVFMGDREAITSPGTSTSRTPAGSGGSSTPSAATTVSSPASHRAASASSFTPSPAHCPQARR